MSSVAPKDLQINSHASSSSSGGGMFSTITDSPGLWLFGALFVVLVVFAVWYMMTMKQDQEEKIQEIKKKVTEEARRAFSQGIARDLASTTSPSPSYGSDRAAMQRLTQEHQMMQYQLQTIYQAHPEVLEEMQKKFQQQQQQRQQPPTEESEEEEEEEDEEEDEEEEHEGTEDEEE